MQASVSLSLGALPARVRPLRRGLAVAASAAGGGRPPVAASAGPAAPDVSSAKLIFAAAPALDHSYPGHPECAERVPAIMDKLAADGLTPELYGSGLAQLSTWAPATPEQVGRVHTPQVLKSLKARGMRPCFDADSPALSAPYLWHLPSLCKIISDRAAQSGGYSMVDSAPTYVTPTTHSDTLVGAGGALTVLDAVVAEGRRREAAAGGKGAKAPAGFALIRPPGHHAVPKGAMGFCILNNASIAARHAQQHHGLQRVLIIDFDVHHGNGTQDAFYSDPDVFFLSLHQAGSYPNTGRVDEAGDGAGEGSTLNIPLPGLSGDACVRETFEEVVLPVAVRFRPDLIIASAGYDAHWRDPLAGLQYRGGTYHRISADLKRIADDLCGGRLLYLLEGGYDLQGLSEGVAESFRGLLGESADNALDPERTALQPEPTDKLRKVLLDVKAVHGL